MNAQLSFLLLLFYQIRNANVQLYKVSCDVPHEIPSTNNNKTLIANDNGRNPIEVVPM